MPLSVLTVLEPLHAPGLYRSVQQTNTRHNFFFQITKSCDRKLKAYTCSVCFSSSIFHLSSSIQARYELGRIRTVKTNLGIKEDNFSTKTFVI